VGSGETLGSEGNAAAGGHHSNSGQDDTDVCSSGHGHDGTADGHETKRDDLEQQWWLEQQQHKHANYQTAREQYHLPDHDDEVGLFRPSSLGRSRSYACGSIANEPEGLAIARLDVGAVT
jgi:hypothetical protein